MSKKNKRPNPLLDPAMQPMLAKYFDAQANAPHPEAEAYRKILEQRKARELEGEAANKEVGMRMSPVGMLSGGDTILAAGASPFGGTEMIVKKSDGVVVLLMPQQMQVKNTRKGPKNYMPTGPLELPLVRMCEPQNLLAQMNRARGVNMLPALLMFQGRFSTQVREVNLL